MIPLAKETETLDDLTLLRRYAQEGAEEAFRALVQRHVDLVYGVALRKVGGDAHLASDVTQRVFSDLAQKAGSLRDHPALVGWLFTSAHYAAAQLVRGERRRRERERKAQLMSEANDVSGPTIDPERLRPLLDDVVKELEERDRLAVLLRYFERRSWVEVGARLKLTDDGARSRVDRALEKMREKLMERGVTSSAAALGVALTGQMNAAPAGLAVAVVRTALLGGKGMMVSVSTTWALCTGVVAAGVALVVWQESTRRVLEAEVQQQRAGAAMLAQLRTKNREMQQEITEVESLQKDDMELARLESEALLLRQQLADRARGAAMSGVVPSEARTREVNVMGQVRKPARYHLPANGALMTLRDAIESAGGLLNTARSTGIRIVRTKEDGALLTYTVDHAIAGSFVLEAMDYIYVSEKLR